MQTQPVRLRVLFGLAGLALLGFAWAPAAHAEGFLDLPGMGAADKATADSAAKVSESSGQEHEPAPQAERVSVAETPGDDAVSEQAEPILNLPGAGALPVINVELAKASRRPRGAGGLELWAGLGSLAAIGGLVALRRLGVL